MKKELAIYNELRAAAKRVFNEGIQAPVGTYTLKDLSNIGKENAPVDIYFRSDYNETDIIKISVDSFECEFYAAFVFALAYRFESLAKVNKKDCAKFTREAEIGEPVAVFTLDATTCDSLTACENPKKTLRPSMACVFMDLAAGLAVCSNGHVINVTRVQDVRIIDHRILDFDLLIPRDFAKSAKGRKVTVYKNGNDLFAVASGVKSCVLVYGKYPEYKAVLKQSAKNETAPAHLAKNARDFKKSAASIAKLTKCEYVFISGMNGDDYITLSAMGDGGEVTRRVALSSCLTFTFANAVKPEDIKIINNAVDTLYFSNTAMMFVGANVAGLSQAYYQADMATPTAEAANNIATQLTEVYNVYQDFIKPADDIQEAESMDNTDTLNISPVASADDIQEAESMDNTDTLNISPVASADDIQEAESMDNTDTLNISPVASADDIQEAESMDNTDTLNISPVASADEIQEAESMDNTDTLNISPVASADEIQEAESMDNTDTLNISPVASADEIQEAESMDNTDTLNISPVASADDIQEAESMDNTDTLNISPVTSADDIQEAESMDNTDNVILRRLIFVCLRVAAVILFALFVRIVSMTNSNADTLNIAPVASADDIQEAESMDNTDTLNISPVTSADDIQEAESMDNTDTLNISPVTSADDIQEAESMDNTDTINISPVTSADDIQEAESMDNTDTLNISPVTSADDIQEAESMDNTDTLNISPVTSADDIQEAESMDNTDTLNISPVTSADDIQEAESMDNTDTLNISPAAHAQNLYIIGH